MRRRWPNGTGPALRRRERPISSDFRSTAHCGGRWLASGRPTRELYDALLGAAAFNLLAFRHRFERATDNAIADNVGWLDFTHALTFANACRHICEERPDLWPRAALQLALFIGRNRKYVRPATMSARWRVDDRRSFLAGATNALYDHGIPEPIIACHRLKVLFALEDELRAAPDAAWAETACAAVNRYLHTPMKRHHGLRNRRAGARLCRQGRLIGGGARRVSEQIA